MKTDDNSNGSQSPCKIGKKGRDEFSPQMESANHSIIEGEQVLNSRYENKPKANSVWQQQFHLDWTDLKLAPMIRLDSNTLFTMSKPGA